MKILPTDFDGQSIRRVFDEATETWWFSVIDVVQVLTESKSPKRYWSDLKRKLLQEAGSDQPYEEIVQLKLTATHALYAYEATAGVRLDSDMLATRKRILFSTQLAKVDSFMLRA